MSSYAMIQRPLNSYATTGNRLPTLQKIRGLCTNNERQKVNLAYSPEHRPSGWFARPERLLAHDIADRLPEENLGFLHLFRLGFRLLG